MPTGLPASRIVNITINVSPAGATVINFNSALIVGDSDVINVSERMRSYGTIAEVAADFGTVAPEYLAAQLYFSQSPQPTQLYIGRWASTNTPALLICGPLSIAEQAMANWTAINDGGFKIAVDGGAVTAVTNIDLSAQSNLNGVASQINARLTAAGLGAVCSWNGTQFVFQSNSAGASSSLSALTAAAGGDTDISAQLKGTAATFSQNVAGIAGETPATAVAALDSLATQWYAISFASPNFDAAGVLAVAAYIESAGNPHTFGNTTSDPAAIVSGDNTSIGYQLAQLGYNRTFTWWSSSSPYAVSSIIGRFVTVNYSGTNTAITGMFKRLPGVDAENLTSSQASALDANNYNYYAQFNNNTSITVNGKMASGLFIDSIWNDDWLANQMQVNIFNLLISTPKIPQTDAGMHTLATVIEAACAQGVVNGTLAPGVWPFAGFGQLIEGGFLDKGYYVYAPPISLQTLADRQARKSVPFQVAANAAGAVHSVSVTLNVNL